MTSESPRPIQLVPLLELGSPEHLALLAIRNQPGIRKWMYTDHEISQDEHARWIESLKGDKRQTVFAVLDSEQSVLGMASVSQIDKKHRKADWAFYLSETARGGLGSALEFAFISYIFGSLKLEKLNCEVIEGNDPVVNLHKKFLFQEEGFRRSNIVKDDQRMGVHFLGLTRSDWVAGREAVRTRCERAFERYSVSVKAPKSDA